MPPRFARHQLAKNVAELCRDLHGPGNPRLCRACESLANPKPWWKPGRSHRRRVEDFHAPRSTS